MEHWKLTKWCTEAVTKIKYAPDRRAVYDELRQHMDDRCEDYLEQGMPTEEAINKAVEVMGDPKELAIQLAAIHRPFWGFAYSISKWLLRIAASFVALAILGSIVAYIDNTQNERSDRLYTRPTEPTFTQFLYAEPNCTDSSDGYTFTVTRAALRQNTISDPELGEVSSTHLYIEMRVTKQNPWAEDCSVIYKFWGTDNCGEVYGRYSINPDNYQLCSTSAFSDLYEYYDFEVVIAQPENLTWYELRYDAAGRDIVLHIDLTGGDGI